MIAIFSILSLLVSFVSSTFPNGRCAMNRCNASPYSLQWEPTKYNDKSGDFTTCFNIRNQLCSSITEYNCCDVFQTYLDKIIISSYPICNQSISQVMVNGIKKQGGVYFQTYGNNEAELKLTNLALNGSSQVLMQTVCITLTPPCNSLDAFCGNSQGICQFALFNPDKHTCCPTCNMPSFNTVINYTSTDSEQQLALDFHIQGAYTTVKVIRLIMALQRNVSFSPKPTVSYVDYKVSMYYSFHVFFWAGPFENAASALNYILVLEASIATLPKFNIIHINSTISEFVRVPLDAPSFPPEPPFWPAPAISLPPPPPPGPLGPQPIQPPGQPRQPGQPGQPGQPTSAPYCNEPNCPNSRWPLSYCKLYVGVPIACPCLCA